MIDHKLAQNDAEPTGDGKYRYKGFIIQYDPPPIPVRGHDWQFHHEDYDGAPDSKDWRSGTSASLNGAIKMIDELLADRCTEQVIDPLARMYDLRKKGPDMTDEDDRELRDLINKHGRPKFMSNDNKMTRPAVVRALSWVRRNCKFSN